MTLLGEELTVCVDALCSSQQFSRISKKTPMVFKDKFMKNTDSHLKILLPMKKLELELP